MAKKQPPKILRAVHASRRLFKPGQEEDLDKILSQDQVDHLTARNAIEGEWSGKGDGGMKMLPSDHATPLPTGFPGRIDLLRAGYDTIEKVTAAGESLLEVKGIGEPTFEKIMDALEGEEEEEE